MAEKDISDVFEDIFLAEDRYNTHGYETGVREGRRVGFGDALLTGVTHGLAISKEVGFYRGFAKTYLKIMKRDNSEYNRTKKSLEALQSLSERLPLNDPQYEPLYDELEVTRAKYKQVRALLALSIDTKKEPGLTY